MSLFKVKDVEFEREAFVTFSDWRPADRFPGSYNVCVKCARPFYTRFNYTYCPDCLDMIERDVNARGRLRRASLSNDL